MGYYERVRNVFISFDVDDEGAVNLLRMQAKNKRFNINFRDYSVKEPFDEAWKSEVRNLISQTSAMIVMIGENTAYSEAVNWEIREAHYQGKEVIGMRIHRDYDDPLPEELYADDPVIDWNLDELNELLQ